jgi:hypothetical protein
MHVVAFEKCTWKAGCLLPRTIVGLVFASDGTQSLAIGDAGLMEAWNIMIVRLTKGGSHGERLLSSMMEHC